MIDLRSDTVTQPTEEMREAMRNASVGDDVYGDDASVNELEEKAARAMGKEAALFVVSGTMGNQLGAMTHTKRGDEIIAGAASHIVANEVGGLAVLSGVSCHLVYGDGMIRAEDVERGIRPKNIHFPDTGLVCLENALGDGRVVPLDIMRATYATAHRHGVPVHLDGARIFNAALALGVDVKEIAACADSVMFCLSKGLCAPVGSMLTGSAEFIAKARRNRKMLGGGMRQAGVLAAPGIIALEKMTGRLGEDHETARYLAERLAAIEGVDCNPAAVQINMVFFRAAFPHTAYVEFMHEHGILVGREMGPGLFRVLTHHGISRADVDTFADALAAFAAQA